MCNFIFFSNHIICIYAWFHYSQLTFMNIKIFVAISTSIPLFYTQKILIYKNKIKIKIKSFPAIVFFLFEKQSVKKDSSQINLQASVWISFIRIITSIWKIKRLQEKGINSSYLMLCATLSFFLTLSSIASTNGDLLGFIFLTLLPIKNPQNKNRKITSLS